MNESSTIRVWNPSGRPAAPLVEDHPRLFRGGYRLIDGCNALIAVMGKRRKAVPVVELSPVHVVVRRAARELTLIEGSPAVRLRSAGGHEVEVQTTLVEEQRGETHAEYVLAITNPTVEAARAILSIGEEMELSGNASLPPARPVVRDTIDSAEKARWILDKMVRNQAQGVVRLGDFPVADVVPIRVEEDAISWRLSGCEVEGPITIELMGFSTLYLLTFEDAVVRGKTLVTALPSKMVRLRNRTYRRAAAPAGTRIEFNHPAFTRHIAREVSELSASGLSFRTLLRDDLLYPGLMTDMVLVANGEAIELSGEVKSLSRSHVGPDHYCGLRVYPSSADDEARWIRFLDQQLYPNTRKGSRWAKETWKLFGRAGYFDLSGKNKEGFEALREAFEATTKRLDAAPELGCHVVWPLADEGVEAVISALKVYSGTWASFQLAKVKGDLRDKTPGMTVLREVLARSLEHAQRDPEMRWLFALVQVKRVWSQLLYRDLPIEYVACGKAYLVRGRTLEVPAIEEAACPAGVEVAPATVEEVAQLRATLAGMRPAAYLDALDLTEEQYRFGAISGAWGRAGLTRRRETLVARRDGRALAAVILESADDGLHLFRLFDCARPHALVPGGEEVFGALLSAAGGWYRAQGKTSFVGFVEDATDIPRGLPDGTENLGLADLVVFAAEHIPEMLERLSALTAPKA